VLLINLKKIREDELTNKMLELVKKDFPVQDQDILNVACYGKILNIPLKYNMMIECYRFSIKQLNKIASTEEIEEARRQPVIYHFATQYKPWKYNDIFNYVEWNQFFEKSPLYITLKRKSSKMDKILFFLKRCYTFPMRKFRSILNK
jgi:lipopolysaccharide biosynthesis glycosyltransferase